ncbi:hypothetical protein GCM10025859_10860 [Alicyclobacillus fastidiosus]|nr:hypothetical protein GCM10025859_10860 [Alicyclobacillus fastidiosus]
MQVVEYRGATELVRSDIGRGQFTLPPTSSFCPLEHQYGHPRRAMDPDTLVVFNVRRAAWATHKMNRRRQSVGREGGKDFAEAKVDLVFGHHHDVDKGQHVRAAALRSVARHHNRSGVGDCAHAACDAHLYVGKLMGCRLIEAKGRPFREDGFHVDAPIGSSPPRAYLSRRQFQDEPI